MKYNGHLAILLFTVCFWTKTAADSSCCECPTIRRMLNCTGRCIGQMPCSINNRINELLYDDNNLNAFPDLRFPNSPGLATLRLRNNNLETILPWQIFNKFRQLKTLDLENNHLRTANFGITENHSLIKFLGLHVPSLEPDSFRYFPHLTDIALTVNGNPDYNDIFKYNIPRVVLNLPDAEDLGNFGEISLGTTRGINFNMARVKTIRKRDFKKIFNILELTLIGNALEAIEDNAFTKAFSLTFLKIIAPKLIDYGPELFTNRAFNNTPKLHSLRLCPVRRTPIHALDGPNEINTVWICNTESSNSVGFPVERKFQLIKFQNGKLRTRDEVKSYSTIEVIANGTVRSEGYVISVKNIVMQNMSVVNLAWLSLFNKTNIVTLDLSQNRLRALITSDMEDLTELVELDLRDNNMIMVEATALRQQRKLRSLNLSGNMIKVFHFYAFVSQHLALVDLSNNQIARVTSAPNNIRIIRLNLQSNQLTDVEEIMEKTMEIARMNLTYNSFTRMPTNFSKKLKSIDLNKNPIICNCEEMKNMEDQLASMKRQNRDELAEDLELFRCTTNQNFVFLRDFIQKCNERNIPLNDTDETSRRYNLAQPETEGHLFPSMGVLFDFRAKVASTDRLITATVKIEIPQIELPRLSIAPEIRKICSETRQSIVKSACSKFTHALQKHLRLADDSRSIAAQKLLDLHVMAFGYDSQKNVTKTRKKRFIGAAINLAVGFTKIYSEFFTKRRLDSMSKAIKAFQAQTIDQQQEIQTLKSDFSILKASADKRYQEMRHKINEYADSFNHLSSRFDMFAKKIQTIIREENQKHESLLFMETMRSTIKQTLDEQIFMYRDLISLTNFYIEGITELKRGRISTHLISPTEMIRIIDSAKSTIAQEFPEYQLVFQDPLDYFSLQNAAYTADENLGLLLQIPLFITPKSIPFLELFRIDTLIMPIKSKQDQNQYSRMVPEHKYLAVHDEYFKPFSADELSLCRLHEENNVYICPFHLVLRHKSTPTCESSIYFNSTLQTVYDHCPVQFFDASYQPESELVQYDNKMILTNIHQPIEFECMSGEPPIEITSNLSYVILDRNAICGCSLKSKKLIVYAQSCEKTEHDARLQFVVNAMAYYAFKPVMQMNYSEEEIRSLHFEELQIDFPHINLSKLQEIQADSDPLDLKALIETNFKDIKMKNQAISVADEMHNFGPLFTKYTIIGISAVFAICLPLLIAIIIAVLHCKQGRLRKLLYALILNSAPKIEAAGPLVVIQNMEEFLFGLALMVASMIFLQICCTVTKTLLFKLQYKAPKLFPARAIKNNQTTKVCIEFKSPKEKYILPFFDVSGGADDLSMQNLFEIIDLKIIKRMLSNKLNITWKEGRDSITVDDCELRFPETIELSLFQARRLTKLIRSNLKITLLSLDNNNIVRIIGSRLTTLNDSEISVVATGKQMKSELKDRKKMLLQNLNFNI